MLKGQDNFYCLIKVNKIISMIENHKDFFLWSFLPTLRGVCVSRGGTSDKQHPNDFKKKNRPKNYDFHNSVLKNIHLLGL